MSRYIDLEAFAERIKKYIKPESEQEKELLDWCKDECIRQGYCIPTADVVPKSEVEKLIIDRNAARLGMIAEHERLKIARAEVAREIINSLVKFVDEKEDKRLIHTGLLWYVESDDLTDFINEINKKYMGENNE